MKSTNAPSAARAGVPTGRHHERQIASPAIATAARDEGPRQRPSGCASRGSGQDRPELVPHLDQGEDGLVLHSRRRSRASRTSPVRRGPSAWRRLRSSCAESSRSHAAKVLERRLRHRRGVNLHRPGSSPCARMWPGSPALRGSRSARRSSKRVVEHRGKRFRGDLGRLARIPAREPREDDRSGDEEETEKGRELVPSEMEGLRSTGLLVRSVVPRPERRGGILRTVPLGSGSGGGAGQAAREPRGRQRWRASGAGSASNFAASPACAGCRTLPSSPVNTSGTARMTIVV